MKNLITSLLLLAIPLLASADGIESSTSETTWTDSNGMTWSFTVSGTKATDIKAAMFDKTYIYGDPNRSDEEKAKDPQLPFQPGYWSGNAMRFSSTEGAHFPTIPDEVYKDLKTLIVDVSEAEGSTLRVTNGWWSSIYVEQYDLHDGANEIPLTKQMADECAKDGEGRDLLLILTGGPQPTINSVYYKNILVPDVVEIPAKVYVGSTELTVTTIGDGAFECCSNLTSVTIPSTVTSIGDKAFFNCSNLTSVNIPESVTTIGDMAFSYCSNLTSINIPEGVTSISDYAFQSCSSLTSVTIPSSVTSIGNYAFEGCRGLISVTIPSNVTSIGESAFERCYYLTNMTIPSSVTYIGNRAFSFCFNMASISVESGNSVYDSRNNCNAIIETATNKLITGCKNTIIPEDVTSIGEYAFAFCPLLTSMTIPSSVTSIGNYAFYDCTGLTSVTIPSSVTSIGGYAFQSCSGLTSITISEGVTTIGELAFYNCSNLTSVTIPNSITDIGYGVFDGCKGLTSVTIPSSVKSIGLYAFAYCSSLSTVTSLIEKPFSIDSSVFISHWNSETFQYDFTTATLYVPAGTKEKYLATEGWNQFQNIVEMDIAPVEEGQTIDIGNEIDENTNLEGTVVDNVFVNISNGDGGFDPVEGCLIVSKPTDDSAINGKDIFGDDFKDNYTGIVFKVNEGKGSIKVEAETQGNMVLKVKIGNSDPIEMELDGKLKVKFPYDVSEETLVYIYGGLSDAAGAKGTRASTDGNDLLKIYGFEIVSDPSGIDAIENGQQADAPVYNLNGQRVNTPGKGVYIKNGRKVLVK